MTKIAISIYETSLGEIYYLPEGISSLLENEDKRTRLGKMAVKYIAAIDAINDIAFELDKELHEILPHAKPKSKP